MVQHEFRDEEIIDRLPYLKGSQPKRMNLRAFLFSSTLSSIGIVSPQRRMSIGLWTCPGSP